jgi:hypothetical protein
LGDGPGPKNAIKPTPVPVALPRGRRAVAISAGGRHTCALLDNGAAVCWGDDRGGQLGNDEALADRHIPTLVSISKATPRSLTLTLKPTRDPAPPHQFQATGSLGLRASTEPLAALCNGTITISARAGTRTLATRSTQLRIRNGVCVFNGTLSISAGARGGATRASVTATFSGNDLLQGVTSKPGTAKLR